jgi:hypothetical protein
MRGPLTRLCSSAIARLNIALLGTGVIPNGVDGLRVSVKHLFGAAIFNAILIGQHLVPACQNRISMSQLMFLFRYVFSQQLKIILMQQY